MIETFNHKAESSFYLWFDHYLLQKGQAYITETGVFYPTVDDTLPGFAVYSSSYKQMVWDTSISGASVITGVYPSSGNSQLQRGTSGLKIDYYNGRIFTDSSLADSIKQFSGVFSRKEFNVYPTNELDFPMALEKIMGNNPNLESPATGIDPYILAAPCCLVSVSNSQNSPFSFGGEDMTEVTARVLIVSKDKWQMDGILSIFRDSNNLRIPLIPSTGTPLDFYGDLKFNYNYESLSQEFCNTNMYIDKVIATKITERKNNDAALLLSSLEFKLHTYRFPRQEL